jgi:zinc transport system permease protein
MGSYLVINRMSFVAGSIAHTVLSGLGVAYNLGGSPIVGAIGAWKVHL